MDYFLTQHIMYCISQNSYQGLSSSYQVQSKCLTYGITWDSIPGTHIVKIKVASQTHL